jgi:hypothetical protein
MLSLGEILVEPRPNLTGTGLGAIGVEVTIVGVGLGGSAVSGGRVLVGLGYSGVAATSASTGCAVRVNSIGGGPRSDHKEAMIKTRITNPIAQGSHLARFDLSRGQASFVEIEPSRSLFKWLIS